MNREGFIYLIRCEDYYKIGFTKDIEKRMKQLDTRPFPMDLIAVKKSKIAFDIEQYIHKAFEPMMVENEWYHFNFSPNDKDFCEFVSEIECRLTEGICL